MQNYRQRININTLIWDKLMEITEIKQKAEKYLNSEENKHFADEIIQLLKDENWDELTER